MNIKTYRNTLIATTVAAGLGLGAAACSDAPDYSASDRRGTSDAPVDLASATTSDTPVAAQIQTTLATDSTLNASEINVASGKGGVTLEASVRDTSGFDISVEDVPVQL